VPKNLRIHPEPPERTGQAFPKPAEIVHLKFCEIKN